jgi:hypothetical protein
MSCRSTSSCSWWLHGGHLGDRRGCSRPQSFPRRPREAESWKNSDRH